MVDHRAATATLFRRYAMHVASANAAITDWPRLARSHRRNAARILREIERRAAIDGNNIVVTH